MSSLLEDEERRESWRDSQEPYRNKTEKLPCFFAPVCPQQDWVRQNDKQNRGHDIDVSICYTESVVVNANPTCVFEPSFANGIALEC